MVHEWHFWIEDLKKNKCVCVYLCINFNVQGVCMCVLCLVHINFYNLKIHAANICRHVNHDIVYTSIDLLQLNCRGLNNRK